VLWLGSATPAKQAQPCIQTHPGPVRAACRLRSVWTLEPGAIMASPTSTKDIAPGTDKVPASPGSSAPGARKRPDLQNLHPNLVLLTDEVKFHVLGDRARSQLAARPGYYSLLVSLSGMLVFAQDRGLESSGPRARVLMAGEVISSSTIVDVIGMISSHRWRGEFQVVTGSTHFQLMIDQGLLRYAASNRPEDDLALWFADLVSQDVARRVRKELLPGQRFEDAVVQRGLLTREQLQERAESLARKVFFDALTLSEGKYAFVVLPSDLDAPPPIDLQMRIQEMLLRGVERIDEVALFRRRIPHGQVRPYVREQPGVAVDDPNQRLILMQADGERTLDEIARLTGLVEYECLKATHDLIEAGHLELRIEELIDDYAVQALLMDFDAVLHNIVRFTGKVERLDALRDSLRQWLQSSGFMNYLGEGVVDSLHLDPSEVCDRMRMSRVEEPVATLKQALFDMVSFCSFVASTQMPHDMALQLSEYVQHALQAIADRWR
jgi:hypothetical protein